MTKPKQAAGNAGHKIDASLLADAGAAFDSLPLPVIYYTVCYLKPCPPGIPGYEPEREFWPTEQEAKDRCMRLVEDGCAASVITPHKFFPPWKAL